MSRDTRQINAGDYYDPADYRGRPIEELPGPEQMIHRTLRPSPVHQHAVHDALHGYAEDPAGNLLLVGATGTGKSTQAQAIAATHMRSAWTVPLLRADGHDRRTSREPYRMCCRRCSYR